MESTSHFFKTTLFLFLSLLFLNKINYIRTETCKDNRNLSNKDCFNDVITFKLEGKKLRAGHSALNKDGIFIMEFSVDSNEGDRIFYGLKPNGKYLFTNDSPTKKIVLEEDNGQKGRYESMNAFISLKNDVNKDKEYFFSISTFTAIMEIYDFTKEEVELDKKNTNDYFGNPVFNFKFELLETKYSGELIYYLIFCHKDGTEPNGEYIAIKKIAFSSLTFNKNDIIKTQTYESKYNDRTITAFIVDDVDEDDYKILVVIFISSSAKYNLKVYKLSDLSEKTSVGQFFGDDLSMLSRGVGYGIYCKAIYLGNKDIAFIYFKNGGDNQDLFFQVLTINKNKDNKNQYGFDSKLYYEIKKKT